VKELLSAAIENEAFKKAKFGIMSSIYITLEGTLLQTPHLENVSTIVCTIPIFKVASLIDAEIDKKYAIKPIGKLQANGYFNQ
jgi:hypothetical protein